MPPRRRKTKDPEEESRDHGETAIEIPDIDDDDSPSSEEDEYDDDPVVKTYDVFVSDQLKDHIYLLQYPIRSQDEQYYAESAPLDARMKPKEGTLELDVPIDPHNYSIFRGEKFAGHPQTESGVKRETRPLDRQRLSGTTQPLHASYFAAVMRGDQMHLSPVKGTIQLRPNFHFFDTLVGGEKRKKGPADDTPAKQPRAVQLQVKRSEDLGDLRTGGQLPTTYEEFIPLQWVDTMDPETLEISDRLLSRDTSKELVSSVSAADFLARVSFKDSVEDTPMAKME